MDIMESNKEAEGYEVDTFEWPVGISYQPYYQFDNGLGIGIGIGPIQLIMGDMELYNVPICADVRYKLFIDRSVSPYVRAGLAYNIVSGDYVDSSNPGFFGGIGIEFAQLSAVGFGIEVLYNASEIEMEKYSSRYYYNYVIKTEEIKPEVMVSIYAIF